MAKVQISDLLLRTIIGTHDWERKKKQDVIINLTFDYNCKKCCVSDALEDTVDYKTLTKKIIEEVEGSSFFLLEKLTDFVLKIVMENKKIERASVRIEKPHALRFARSVSVELTAER